MPAWFPWLPFAWSAIVALPGIIAFVWAWRDRGKKERGERPYAEMLLAVFPAENGWYAGEVRVRNRWQEPATITLISGPKELILAKAQPSTGTVDEASAGRTVEMDMRVGPPRSDEPWSRRFSLFVRPAPVAASSIGWLGALQSANERKSLRISMTSYSRLFSEFPMKLTTINEDMITTDRESAERIVALTRQSPVKLNRS